MALNIEDRQVKFWSHQRANGFLSNFFMAEIRVDGLIWPSTEHYYQAMRFEGLPMAEAIRRCPDAKAAKELAWSVPAPESWTLERRIRVMQKAVMAKFTQHEELRIALLATGTAEIIEASKNDGLWGWGPDKDGINLLGILLMQLRAQLSGDCVQTSQVELSNPSFIEDYLRNQAEGKSGIKVPKKTMQLWNKYAVKANKSMRLSHSLMDALNEELDGDVHFKNESKIRALLGELNQSLNDADKVMEQK
ncbi:NADAR family protein [Neptuniibacter sp. QD37_11]|uniref:NADAR family protein n=1 Tax=Neptuniibacter sp. QD37_11 TaxID=3398209 RepID=UPI0039F59837